MRPADAKQRRAGTDEQWELAERAFGKALDENGKEYAHNAPGVAPVGPRIDIVLVDSKGQKHEGGFIECDFELPVRMNLQY